MTSMAARLAHGQQWPLVRKLWTRKRAFEADESRKVFPGKVSPQLKWDEIPKHIQLPPYALAADGRPPAKPEEPEVKSEETIERMRKACSLARRVLDEVGQAVKPGVTTQALDEKVNELCFVAGCYPSPLNYCGFPKSVCTSVNNVACHGIPDDRPLLAGDVVNVDVTVYLNGVHGDCSETFAVGGKADQNAERLLAACKEALAAGIAVCIPGAAFSDVGAAVEANAGKNGFQVMPFFTGHGIGSYFHGPPDIFHVRNRVGGRMQPGHTFTVEPILVEGSPEMFINADDGWTAITEDGGRSAQFEHTVLVTHSGCEILTQ